MGEFLLVVGFLGVIVFVILGIISSFKKNKKAKKNFIIALVSFVLFIVGGFTMDTSTTTSTESKTEESSKVESKKEDKKIEIQINDVPKTVALKEESVTIQGEVANAKSVTVQGNEIQLDENNFSTTVSLVEGLNTIVIKANDGSKELEKKVEITRENPLINVSMDDSFNSNSKAIDVTGNTEAEATIDLYKGSVKINTITSDTTGKFTVNIPTEEEGTFHYSVKVNKEGFRETKKEFSILRTLSEEEKAQAKRSTAKEIPYNQIKKDADKLTGEYVKYTGEVVQIMESDGYTVIRLSVEKKSYGYNSSAIVWVEYIGSVDVYEEDIVTVYGTVLGQHSYTSQAGWDIEVPSMLADSIE